MHVLYYVCSHQDFSRRNFQMHFLLGALRVNYKLEQYVSFRPDSHALAVGTFSLILNGSYFIILLLSV